MRVHAQTPTDASAPLRESTDLQSNVRDIVRGENLHEATLRLTGALVARTRDVDFATKLVRVLMAVSTAPRDARFRERLADVERLASDAGRKFELRGQADVRLIEKIASARIPKAWFRTPPPPVNWLVNDWIVRGTVTAIFGEGGIGKSTLALRLAVSVATGSPWFGLETQKGRVLVIAFEDTDEDFRRRLWTIVRNDGERPGADVEQIRNDLRRDLSLVSMVGESFHFVDIEGGRPVRTKLVEELLPLTSGFDLIIVDPLARLSTADENSNAAAGELIGTLEAIARTSGASVVVPGHVSKNAAASRTKTQYAGRGASAVPNAVRGVLRLILASDEDGDKIGGFTSADVAREGVLQLIHAKRNYGPKPPDIWLRRVGEDLERIDVVPSSTRAVNRIDMLRAWYDRNGGRPFFKNTVREHFKKIFGPSCTRKAALRAFGFAVRTGAVIRVTSDADNPAAKAYRFKKIESRQAAGGTAGIARRTKDGAARAAARRIR